MASLVPPRGEGGLAWKHVVAATVGNALEFYDFLIYSLFAVEIGRTFFPSYGPYASLMLSLATFGAGFITRPLGAIVVGAYADRVGRRPAMMLCFALSGLSIIALAVTPSYRSIGIAAPLLALLARMTQGFSVGGESGSNTAYLVEAASPARRGFTVSFGAASQLFALMIGGLVGTTLTAVLPPQALDAYGWRIAFLLGAAILPVGLYLRKNLPETLHVVDDEPVASGHVPGTAARLRSHRKIIFLGLVVLSCGTIHSYIFTYIVTYAQNTLHMPARAGFTAQASSNLLAIVAVLAGGWISDRVGRRPVNLVGQLTFLVLIYPVFLWVTETRSTVALVAGMAALTAAGSIRQGVFYTALAESLPVRVRVSAFGTVYSLAIAAFGSTTQLVITWLIHLTGSPLVPAWYLIGATTLGFIALFFMPESAPAFVGTPTPDHSER